LFAGEASIRLPLVSPLLRSLLFLGLLGLHPYGVSSPMVGLSDLDFSIGLFFQQKVKDLFGVSVSPISSSSVFSLVSLI
jgi:hypothetical protein